MTEDVTTGENGNQNEPEAVKDQVEAAEVKEPKTPPKRQVDRRSFFSWLGLADIVYGCNSRNSGSYGQIIFSERAFRTSFNL